MLTLSHSFPRSQRSVLSRQIYRAISADPKLNPRSQEFFLSLLNQNRLIAGFQNQRLVTVLGVRKLIQDYNELVSWFVFQTYRQKGYGKATFSYALAHFPGSFIAASFDARAALTFPQFGFQQTSLYRLPPLVLFKILTTRNVRSVIQHFGKTKSTWWFRP